MRGDSRNRRAPEEKKDDDLPFVGTKKHTTEIYLIFFALFKCRIEKKNACTSTIKFSHDLIN